jgi:hypothetical protein
VHLPIAIPVQYKLPLKLQLCCVWSKNKRVTTHNSVVSKEFIMNTISVVACFKCGALESSTLKFRVCGRCKEVRYCSRECQVESWKEHKIFCGPKALRRAMPLSRSMPLMPLENSYGVFVCQFHHRFICNFCCTITSCLTTFKRERIQESLYRNVLSDRKKTERSVVVTVLNAPLTLQLSN